MKKVIKVGLSTSEIDRAIKEVESYKKWVKTKTDELTQRLAVLGAMEASFRFSGAYIEDNSGVEVSVKPIDNGYMVVAKGKAVCFIEFGAGVYYNGDEPYPNPPGRPQGVVGIGQYGKGKGKRKAWGYYDENGKLVITHGTPAAMPLYHAGRRIEDEVQRVIQEVFA